ncbi:MAG: ABC transporter ATP-binding protein [Patescibacteria group bacterium]|nr:ABC transporter ATP-binding protein [Patescibacteria group bacterium]
MVSYPSMTRRMLEVSHLSKKYGETRAVDDVSFFVNESEIVGLLGPNGAGKTSTINMVLGVLTPSAGVISINNTDLAKNRAGALEQTNFAAVYAQLPGNLTVYENLNVFGNIYGVPALNTRIEELTEYFDLKKFLHTKAGVLSSGEQTRLGLAKAMLNKPKLLLLDEPTASLDPSTAKTIREGILSYARSGQGGVLWTSHNMYEVADVCDRVLFVSHGKVILEGNPRTLPQEHNTVTLEELFISIAREPLSVETADA